MLITVNPRNMVKQSIRDAVYYSKEEVLDVKEWLIKHTNNFNNNETRNILDNLFSMFKTNEGKVIRVTNEQNGYYLTNLLQLWNKYHDLVHSGENRAPRDVLLNLARLIEYLATIKLSCNTCTWFNGYY